MTGPEHYAEGERQLVIAESAQAWNVRSHARQMAIAHFTAAQAAFHAAHAYGREPGDYPPGQS